jgi:hypothetical protein
LNETGGWVYLSVVDLSSGFVYTWLTFWNHTLIEIFSSGFDFHFSNAIMIAIEMQNRIDRTLIFFIFNQIQIEKLLPDFDLKKGPHPFLSTTIRFTK